MLLMDLVLTWFFVFLKEWRNVYVNQIKEKEQEEERKVKMKKKLVSRKSNLKAIKCEERKGDRLAI